MTTYSNGMKTSVLVKIISTAVILSFIVSSIPQGWAAQTVLPIDQKDVPTKSADQAAPPATAEAEPKPELSTTQTLATADLSPLSKATAGATITSTVTITPLPVEVKEPEIGKIPPAETETFKLTNGHEFIHDKTNHTGIDIGPDGAKANFQDVLALMTGQSTCASDGGPCDVLAASMPMLTDDQVIIGYSSKEEILPDGSKRTTSLMFVGVPVKFPDTTLSADAVKAIADYLHVTVEQITALEFLKDTDQFYCMGTGCAMWSGDLKVTTKTGDGMERYFEGTLAQIFDVKPADIYRIILNEVDSPIVKALKDTVKNDLMANYGLNTADLDAWIKNGQIIIKVDPKNLTVSVLFTGGVTFPADAIFYIDPLGMRKPLEQIAYQLKPGLQMGAPCSADLSTGVSICPPPNFVIDSARAIIDDYTYQISYGTRESDPPVLYFEGSGSNEITSVRVYYKDPTIVYPMVCTTVEGQGNVCASTGVLVKTIQYSYDDAGITADIHYIHPDKPAPDWIVARTVKIGLKTDEMEFLDGKKRITEVTDVDAAGKKVVSKFKYLGLMAMTDPVCSPGENCVYYRSPITSYMYQLWRIDRSNADGRPMSETQLSLWTGSATVHVEDSQEKVNIRFSDLEDLLDQVKKLEAVSSRILIVKGDHFVTTIELDENGRPVSAKRVYDDGTVEIYGNLTGRGDAEPEGGFRDKHAVNLWASEDNMASIWGDLIEVDHPDGSKTLHSYGENFNFVTTIEIAKDGNPVSARRVYDDGSKVEIYGELFVRQDAPNVRLAAPPEGAVMLSEPGLITYWGILEQSIFQLENGHKFVYSPKSHTGVDIAPDGTQTSYEDVAIMLTKQTTCIPNTDECSILVSQIAIMEDQVFIGSYETKETLGDGREAISNYTILGIPTLVKTIKAQVKNDLIINYGLNADALDVWIRNGQIIMKVDPKLMTVSVLIGEGVTLPADAILYIDPLGERKLPGQITYQLKPGLQMGMACFADLETGVSICPPVNFVIDSARAVLGNFTYEISYGMKGSFPPVIYFDSYGGNEITSVKVYFKDPKKAYPMLCTVEAGCPSILGDLVKEIRYWATSDVTDPNQPILDLNGDGKTDDLDKALIEAIHWGKGIVGSIRYLNPEDGITNRFIKIGFSWQNGDPWTAFADGKNRILEVDDFDAFGNKVINKFQYVGYASANSLALVYCPDVEGGACTMPPVTFGYVLWGIDRFDAQGNALSHINLQAPGSATVFVEKMQEKIEVKYSDFEDLLAQVRKLEAENSLRAVEVLIKKDLMKNFGFDEESLNLWVKQGLIKIKIGTLSLDMRQVEVFIDPSLKVGNAVFLPDPLGSHKLPGLIQYQVKMTIPDVDCMEGATCHAQPIYTLLSANFQIDDNFYELKYLPNTYTTLIPLLGDNRLYAVQVYKGDPRIVCITAPCPTGQLIRDIRYIYRSINGSAEIFAMIRYFNQGDHLTIRRLVKMALESEGMKFMDGKFRVVESTNYDSIGTRVVNKFRYMGTITMNSMVCVEGGVCGGGPTQYGYELWTIDRVDASGKTLSHIFFPSSEKAVVTLEPSKKEVTVAFLNFEDLFEQVRRLELNAQILSNLELYIRNHPAVRFLTSNGYNPNLDLNDDKMVNSTDQIMMRSIETASREVFDRIYKKIMAEVSAHVLTAGTDQSKVPFAKELDFNGDGITNDVDVQMVKSMFASLNLRSLIYEIPVPLKGQELPVVTKPVEVVASLPNPIDTSRFKKVIQDLELLIRKNPSGRLSKTYNANLDLNDDGVVNATDQIMMRNIAKSDMETFKHISDKVLAEVKSHFKNDYGILPKPYVPELDPNKDGTIDQTDADFIKLALDLERGLAGLL